MRLRLHSVIELMRLLAHSVIELMRLLAHSVIELMRLLAQAHVADDLSDAEALSILKQVSGAAVVDTRLQYYFVVFPRALR